MDLKTKGMIKSYWSGVIRAAVVALLILLQFGVIFGFSLWLAGSFVYMYIFIELASIVIIIGLVNDNRSGSYKIGWICIVLIFPITGHVMYALWGKNDSTKKIEKKVISRIKHGTGFYTYDKENLEKYEKKYFVKARMAKYLESNRFPLFCNNRISYYRMGEDAFEAIIEDIKKAERFILIDFFIVGEGALWDKIHELLQKKSEQGIEIFFLYDDFGSMFRTEKDFKKKLEDEGIKVRIFNPVHKYMDKLYFNYRSHQKIIVVDGNIGYTGGMNLADEYINIVKRFGTWKDNAVKVEGDAVWGLTVTFFQMWEVAGNGTLMDYTPYKPTAKFEQNECFCQIVSDGPANNPHNPIADLYKQMIFYARERIYITTPYLIIDDDMKDALIAAARSGVDVRIITPAIPDKKRVKLLTEYNYGALLRSGIRIYEYSPGFIHAKTVLTEDMAIVGTINMDYRSFYLHYECGAFFANSDAVEAIQADLNSTFEISREISYSEWKNRPWQIKVVQAVLNLFATLM